MDEAVRERFLEREEAIEKIYELIDAGFLNKDMENNLQEIANLIQYELEGEHFWGQPYASEDKLHIAYDEDSWTEELMEEAYKQHLNARFIPSKNEINALKQRYYDNRGINEDSTFSEREQCEKDFMYHYGINNVY